MLGPWGRPLGVVPWYARVVGGLGCCLVLICLGQRGTPGLWPIIVDIGVSGGPRASVFCR